MANFPVTGQNPLWGPQLKSYIDQFGIPTFASMAEAEEALGKGWLQVGQTFLVTGA